MTLSDEIKTLLLSYPYEDLSNCEIIKTRLSDQETEEYAIELITDPDSDFCYFYCLAYTFGHDQETVHKESLFKLYNIANQCLLNKNSYMI